MKCHQKEVFNSRKKALTRMNMLNGRPPAGMTSIIDHRCEKIYHCPICHKWHLTSQE